MKSLKKKRASLRGSNDIDTAAEMMEVKDVIKSQLDSMVEIQKNLQDGDEDGAGFALKSMVGRTDSLVEMSKRLEGDEAIDLLSSFEGNALSLDDIPNDQLIQFIPSSIFDELVEHTQGNTFVSFLPCDFSYKVKSTNFLLLNYRCIRAPR